jgi:hypothetical protein
VRHLPTPPAARAHARAGLGVPPRGLSMARFCRWCRLARGPYCSHRDPWRRR